MIVCAHASSHFEYAKRTLEAGKSILAERPFTPTLTQAKELFELIRSRGLTITLYQNYRFDSCFSIVKKAAGSDELGGVVEVENRFDYYRPEAETKPEPS